MKSDEMQLRIADLEKQLEGMRSYHESKDRLWRKAVCERQEAWNELDEIETVLKEAQEVLESIASKHNPCLAEKESWLLFNHEQCAEVLATDTKLAREALDKIVAFNLLMENR